MDERLRRGRPQTWLAIRPPRREEKHLLLLDWFLDNDAGGGLQTLPADTHRAVMLELVTYWDWEDVHGSLNRQIAAYKRLMDTLECATNFFCSWDPSLESLPGQPSKLLEPDKFTLGKFTVLCSELDQKPAFLQQFSPLATLRHQHRILLPLDHRIRRLPFLAAYAVFPDIRPLYAMRVYKKTEPRVINTLTFSSEASRTSIYEAVNRLLPSARSHIASLGYYSKAFDVYDLKCDGKSWPAIAKQVLSEEFEKIEPPYDYTNNAYRKVIQRVTDLFKIAKDLIDDP
jgi:hypothetical protein